MNIRLITILLLLLLVFDGLFAQKKISKDTPGKKVVIQLEEAKVLREKDPRQAIKVIENVLNNRAWRGDKMVESEAYLLLGSIYEDIDQPSLAMQRYKQALGILEKSKFSLPEQEAKAWQNIGNLELKLKNYEAAENGFNMCLRLTNDETQKMQCIEGQADLAILTNDLEKGRQLNEQLKNNSGPLQFDSLFVSRTLARDAQIFANSNNTSQAESAYEGYILNLPSNTSKLDEKDIQQFARTKEALDDKVYSLEDRVSISHSYSPEKYNIGILPLEASINDQLELAEKYIKEDSLDKAEAIIKASKKTLTDKVNTSLKAQVLKKSSEINAKKGLFEQAFKDLEQYNELNQTILNNKEEEADRLISILKGQGKIDIQQKEFLLYENQLFAQKIIIGLLSALLFAAGVFFYFIMKNVKARRKANQLLLLKSLRTQMNPHFIFNALNSVNNFISKNDEKAANKFLADFSRLMRMVLEHSQKDFIPLEEELQLIQLYLKLEHSRFKDKFEYSFEKGEFSNDLSVNIPPMLVQPFIENAIWHGLRYKKEKGQLWVAIKKVNDEISIIVRDNGIGRKKSKELKTDNQKKYKSTGMENVEKRMALIKELYGKHFEVRIDDYQPEREETGTMVNILIPLST